MQPCNTEHDIHHATPPMRHVTCDMLQVGEGALAAGGRYTFVVEVSRDSFGGSDAASHAHVSCAYAHCRCFTCSHDYLF